MWNLIVNLFNKGKKVEALPSIGEEWCLIEEYDPWGGKKYPLVKILDIKEGWVKYCIGKGGYLFQDERKKACDFVKIYRFVKSHNQSID